MTTTRKETYPQGGKSNTNRTNLRNAVEVSKYINSFGVDVVELYNSGATAKEIKKKLHLRGVTPEKVEAHIHRGKFLQLLINRKGTLSELAWEAGIEKSEAEAICAEFSTTLQEKTAEGMSLEQIAEYMGEADDSIESIVNSLQYMVEMDKILNYYYEDYKAEDVTSWTEIEENRVKEDTFTFELSVLNYKKEGKSGKEIADIMGVGVAAVVVALKRQKADVQAMYNVSMSDFIKEKQLSDRDRLMFLADMRDLLMPTITQEELYKIPTDKRANILLKVEEAIRIEMKAIAPDSAVFSTTESTQETLTEESRQAFNAHIRKVLGPTYS